jgi:hypothetical protein
VANPVSKFVVVIIVTKVDVVKNIFVDVLVSSKTVWSSGLTDRRESQVAISL